MNISTINFERRRNYNPTGYQTAYPKKEYDGLSIYRQSIARYPRITRDEEIDLFEKVKTGGDEAEKAREKLILSNLRIPYAIASRYSIPKLPIEDLIQVGNIGLMSAVSNDYDNNFAFSTYAYFKIVGNISHEIDKNNRVIRVPNDTWGTKCKIKKFIQEFELLQSRKPTIGEIADGTGVSEKRIKNVFEFQKPEISLNDKIKYNRKQIEYIDLIEDTNSKNPFEMQEAKELSEDIKKALEISKLTPNEKFVIISHFGFSDDGAKTIKEIAKELKISVQRVAQLKFNALNKLKRNKLIRYHRDIFN